LTLAIPHDVWVLVFDELWDFEDFVQLYHASIRHQDAVAFYLGVRRCKKQQLGERVLHSMSACLPKDTKNLYVKGITTRHGQFAVLCAWTPTQHQVIVGLQHSSLHMSDCIEHCFDDEMFRAGLFSDFSETDMLPVGCLILWLILEGFGPDVVVFGNTVIEMYLEAVLDDNFIMNCSQVSVELLTLACLSRYDSKFVLLKSLMFYLNRTHYRPNNASHNFAQNFNKLIGQIIKFTALHVGEFFDFSTLSVAALYDVFESAVVFAPESVGATHFVLDPSYVMLFLDMLCMARFNGVKEVDDNLINKIIATWWRESLETEESRLTVKQQRWLMMFPQFLVKNCYALKFYALMSDKESGALETTLPQHKMRIESLFFQTNRDKILRHHTKIFIEQFYKDFAHHLGITWNSLMKRHEKEFVRTILVNLAEISPRTLEQFLSITPITSDVKESRMWFELVETGGAVCMELVLNHMQQQHDLNIENPFCVSSRKQCLETLRNALKLQTERDWYAKHFLDRFYGFEKGEADIQRAQETLSYLSEEYVHLLLTQSVTTSVEYIHTSGDHHIALTTITTIVGRLATPSILEKWGPRLCFLWEKMFQFPLTRPCSGPDTWGPVNYYVELVRACSRNSVLLPYLQNYFEIPLCGGEGIGDHWPILMRALLWAPCTIFDRALFSPMLINNKDAVVCTVAVALIHMALGGVCFAFFDKLRIMEQWMQLSFTEAVKAKFDLALSKSHIPPSVGCLYYETKATERRNLFSLDVLELLHKCGFTRLQFVHLVAGDEGVTLREYYLRALMGCIQMHLQHLSDKETDPMNWKVIQFMLTTWVTPEDFAGASRIVSEVQRPCRLTELVPLNKAVLKEFFKRVAYFCKAKHTATLDQELAKDFVAVSRTLHDMDVVHGSDNVKFSLYMVKQMNAGRFAFRWRESALFSSARMAALELMFREICNFTGDKTTLVNSDLFTLLWTVFRKSVASSVFLGKEFSLALFKQLLPFYEAKKLAKHLLGFVFHMLNKCVFHLGEQYILDMMQTLSLYIDCFTFCKVNVRIPSVHDALKKVFTTALTKQCDIVLTSLCDNGIYADKFVNLEELRRQPIQNLFYLKDVLRYSSADNVAGFLSAVRFYSDSHPDVVAFCKGWTRPSSEPEPEDSLIAVVEDEDDTKYRFNMLMEGSNEDLFSY
jgi:hypothetical protein